jgi:prepilin-type N-terminal cleavage/methylation domain-containing protein
MTPNRSSFQPKAAFTMIEIMVVVAIVGVIAAAGIPTLYSLLHREGLRKAVGEMQEICQNARARAIMQQTNIQVVFRPRDGTCAVAGEGDTIPGTVTSAQFDKDVTIEALGINSHDFTDAAQAQVCFYANGTSDEMKLVLRQKDQYRMLALEVTTGLVLPPESDPRRWR